MAPDFENNRSSWSITVTLREVLNASVMQESLNRDGSDTSVTWITRGDNGRRLWICSDDVQLAWVSALAAPTDPHFALPIPDMFVAQLLDLCQITGEVELYSNEPEGTIIARTAEGRYLAVDHPKTPRFTPRDLPYLESPAQSHDSPAVAELTTTDLAFFADAVLTVPNHLSLGEPRIPPFVTITLDKNMFAWTVDWRRYGCGRHTGGVPAAVTGSVTVSLYPYNLAKFLKFFDHPADAKIFIDGPEAEFGYFVGDDWGYRIALDQEVLARWIGNLRAALEPYGVEYDVERLQQIPDRVLFEIDGVNCWASLHLSDEDLRETVRLTYIAAHHVDVESDVLDTINNLNNELVGIVVLVRDGEVRVLLETSVQHLTDFEPFLQQFATAVRKVSKLTSFLPLLH